MRRIFLTFAAILISTVALGDEFFVSVSRAGSDSAWAKEMCATVATGLAEGNSTAKVSCTWNEKQDFQPQEISRARNSGKFGYLVEVKQEKNDDVRVRVVNWNPATSADFTQSGWMIKACPEQQAYLISLFGKFGRFAENPQLLKAQLVADAIDESKEVGLNSKGTSFIDKLTGEKLAPEKAVAIYQTESKRQANYLRAGIELAIELGLGAFNYSRDSSNQRDWDIPTANQAFKDKILSTRGWSTDTNSINVNDGHAFAGMFYYQTCRSNGMKSVESALCALVASSIWETAIEYHENASINDQVVTIIGGSVIGETLNIISRYMRYMGDSPAKRALGYVFDPMYAINHGMDKLNAKRNGKDLPPEEFNKDLWGKVEFYSGYEQLVNGKVVSQKGANTKSAVTLGMNARVINIANYEDNGQLKEFIKDTALVDLNLKYGITDSALNELLFMTRVVWVGWHEKQLVKTSDGGLNGFNWIIGPASGFELRKNFDGTITGKPDDFFLNVNVIGAKAYLTLYKGQSKLTTTVEFFGDYAMVHSLAVQDYLNQNGSQGYAAVLRDQNYYYGLGTTSRGQVIYEYGKYEVSAWGTYSQANITNSRYRDQANITKNLNASDSRGEAGAYASYKITKDVSLKLDVRRIRRTGEAEGLQKKNFQTIVGASVNYLF